MAALTAPRDEETAAAINEADPALLLAALTLWKGDPGLLDRYADGLRPAAATHEGPRLLGAAHGLHDADPEVAEAIRAAVLTEMTHGTEVPTIDEVDDATFRRAASLVVADEVGREFLPMLREQAGFEKAKRVTVPTRKPDPDFEVIIIGSGMSGMNAGVKLGEAGFRYKIFEKEAELGGTWNVNRYPGAAVDTPSHFYSFSFELNPEWKLYYPTGPEYFAYLQHVADKYGIREHLQLNTRVIACEWVASRGRWRVVTESNGRRETHWARAVLTAVGFLNGPNKPTFPGAESFRGTIMHSAEWDESVALEGKNVVLVGAGCTAVQIVTAIAPTVEHLAIVQRERQWIVPARTGTPVSDAQRWLLANVPFYHQWFRLRAFWHGGASGSLQAFARVDPEWSKDHVSSSAENDALMQVSLHYIDDIFADRPDLKDKVTPGYPPLTKRLIMDPGYFPTLKRPNVDLHDGGVDHLDDDAVVLSDGTRIPCDVLVLATGFKAEWLSPIDIRGRDGISLEEAWSGEPHAFQGVTVPGFPNLFMTCGPNSAPSAGGHNLTCEEQVHFMVESLQLLVEEDLQSLEVTAEASAQYNQRLDEAVDGLVWGRPTVRSYQHSSSGRGLVNNPWLALDYWTWMRAPRAEDFILTPRNAG